MSNILTGFNMQGNDPIDNRIVSPSKFETLEEYLQRVPIQKRYYGLSFYALDEDNKLRHYTFQTSLIDPTIDDDEEEIERLDEELKKHVNNKEIHKTSEEIRSEIVDADIPDTIARVQWTLDQIDKAIIELIGGASDEYNTLKRIQTKIEELRAKIYGDDGGTVLNTLEQALKFLNQYKDFIVDIPDNFVSKQDIVDNLTTDDPTKVLSARQGKVLSETLTNYFDSVMASIRAETNRATNAENRIEAKLDKEIDRSIKEDQRIDAKLDAEIKRSTDEDLRIDSKLDAEIERSTNEDIRIDNKLDSEINRSTAEDDRLDQKIDAETTRATTAESNLNTKIETETDRAEGEESRIEAKLDNEITRSTNKDTEHDNRLQALEGQTHEQNTDLGTTNSTFQLKYNTGNKIKHESDAISVRNAADTDYVNFIAKNATFKGDLLVEGQSFVTEAETVEIKDNLLLLNKGEVGAGVTKGIAGLEIDRGTEPNYFIIFDESDNRFKAGVEGDLWNLALRESDDNMLDGYFISWNSKDKILSTTNIVNESTPLLFGRTDYKRYSGDIVYQENVYSSYSFIDETPQGTLYNSAGESSWDIDTTKLNFRFWKPILGTTFRRTLDNSEVLYHADIVNNLTSGGTNKVLSAEQGKLLQNSITSIQGSYLPLSGGTLTGQLTIKQSVDIKLRLQSTDADNYCIIQAINSQASQLGVFGYARDKWAIGHGGTYYEIWDKYNLTNPVRYALDASNYPTLLDSNGSSFSYIKAGTNGLLPHSKATLASGGSGFLGTSDQSFNAAYINNLYTNKVTFGVNGPYIIGGTSATQFLDANGGVQKVATGGLYVGVSYASDALNLVPASGIYSHGNIRTSGWLTFEDNEWTDTGWTYKDAKGSIKVLSVTNEANNKPTSYGSVLQFNSRQGHWCTQIWCDQTNVAGVIGKLRFRTTKSFNSTEWNPWTALVTSSDLGNYLPLTGGTLSGNLTINTVGSTTFVINNNDTNAFETFMRVLRKGTASAAIGFRDNLGAYIYNYNSKKYLFIDNDGYARFGTTSGSTRLALITDIPSISGYLPLSGGTMSGNISFNGDTGHIVVGARETSNYVSAVSFNKGSATNSALIGYHSTGGSDSSGALILVPYSTSADPWAKTVGLYIAKNELLLDGKAIATQEYVTWNNVAGKPTIYERTIGINGTYWSFYAPTNATSAMIYGPTSAGTSGQILQSTGGVPKWVNASSAVGNFVSKSGDTMTGALTMHSRSNNIVVDVVGGAGDYWDEGAGALSIQVPNDSGQTPLILARRSGAAINTTVATERLLSMELLDTGHVFIIGMSGSEALQLDWTSGKAGTGKLFGKQIATTDQIPSIPSISISNSGSGNAVTAISASGHTLTVTKGATYLTSSSLDGYATQTWAKGQFAPLSRFNTSEGYTTIKVTGKEFNFDSTNPEIFMNYRTPSGSSAVTRITWKGGSSTTLCEGRWGNLYMNDNLVATQSWASGQFPTKTGIGASGTWGISITGNAATATNSTQLGGTAASSYVKANDNISRLTNDSGYTTQEWVNGQGFLTSDSILDKFVPTTGGYIRNSDQVLLRLQRTGVSIDTRTIEMYFDDSNTDGTSTTPRGSIGYSPEVGMFLYSAKSKKFLALENTGRPFYGTSDNKYYLLGSNTQYHNSDGYQRIGDIMIQWGFFTVQGNSTKAVNFSVSFTNTVWSVTGSWDNTSTGGQENWGFTDYTSSGFTIINGDGSSRVFHYIAIGPFTRS